ncbi:MAG TPA: SDR family NAD(P)-dependent oxidoreductase [Chloroflexota bacterium]|jgi:NAD(P)-dependent dehydrogenase (short-subunit alcohol dehydrogenase family)|nr:SDR family NAD(P)-dependent oxidoreductase [Chloroflexota bacterium]
MLSDFDLTGRKALVTGAGRGIGKGIALALAEAGADVGVTALGDANAQRVAGDISALGRRGFGWAADGTRVAPMEQLLPDVLAKLGGLDIVVNCIGDSIRGSVAAAPDQGQPQKVLTERDWHTVIDINLTQAFVGCHVFGPHLLQQRHGSVINVSSFAALRPGAQMSAYAAAKAGLTRFTESVALEWAPYGIRVNGIAPGTFPDPEQLTPEQWQQRQQQGAPGVPLGRFGQLREVGLLAIYLSSPAAAYITGQTICIDGGRTLV